MVKEMSQQKETVKKRLELRKLKLSQSHSLINLLHNVNSNSKILENENDKTGTIHE